MQTFTYIITFNERTSKWDLMNMKHELISISIYYYGYLFID